ncbi:MAG: hypothetical protein BWY72_02081 [Bacteroidetes bacterium ADurb.Bin416]|nr:MAG: hypothetical protein BWY72_02081 [Bacteroidetes bacterium ADurb.Bin416]
MVVVDGKCFSDRISTLSSKCSPAGTYFSGWQAAISKTRGSKSRLYVVM